MNKTFLYETSFFRKIILYIRQICKVRVHAFINNIEIKYQKNT